MGFVDRSTFTKAQYRTSAVANRLAKVGFVQYGQNDRRAIPARGEGTEHSNHLDRDLQSKSPPRDGAGHSRWRIDQKSRAPYVSSIHPSCLRKLTSFPVSRHQRNHARIQLLRSTADALDTQIKGHLTLLTTTRNELIAAPAAVSSETTTPVHYAELLSYARRISKFTMPPTFREATSDAVPGPGPAGAQGAATPAAIRSPAANIETKGGSKGGTPAPDSSDPKANGALTPAAVASGAPTPASNTQQESSTALPPVVAEWLNPLAAQGANWTPWPSEDKIRQGALASIQILLDSGVDPETFDPEHAEALEAERKRLEEEKAEEERKRVEKREREERERMEEMARRQSVSGVLGGGGPAREEARPKVFTGLDILDDDMDEDDD